MSNEKKDIEAINLLHKEYFRLLSDNKLDQLKDILYYPSIFKGFLDEIVIATKGDDLKDIYKKLIAKAPQADPDDNVSTSTLLKKSIPYKLRDDSYVIIMEYSQVTEDDSEIFSGRAGYLFTNSNNEWKISGVF